MDAAALDRFHSAFVERHSSPARRQFVYEFGAAAADEVYGPLPVKKESMAEVTSPSVSKLYGGLRFETTNQFRYKPLPTGTVMPTAFLPETKHRYMKSPT